MNTKTLGCLLAVLIIGWFTSFFMGGCATILNGDYQPVSFSSVPDNATVKIDGVAMGKTPCVIPVARKGGDKFVEFELNGYKTVTVELNNQIAAAGFGNILFGGLIGAGIDAASGRAGSYQKSLHIMLEPGMGTVAFDPKSARDLKDETKDKTKEKYTEASASQVNPENDEVDLSRYSESTRQWILEKTGD